MPVFDAQAQVIATTPSYGINGPRDVNYDAGETIEFSYTHDEFTFTRLGRDYRDINDLRNFNVSAGDFEQVVHSDGAWDVEDTSGGNNTFTISPPNAHQPTFIEDTFLLADYRESQRSPSGTTEVELSFVRKEPRDPEDENTIPAQSNGADDWHFDFNIGIASVAIPRERVSSNDQSKGQTVELTALITQSQAETIMEVPNRLDATSIERIPDERDYARDNNPRNRNTFTLTPPTSLDADWHSGADDYVMTDWRIATTVIPFKFEWTVTFRPLLP